MEVWRSPVPPSCKTRGHASNQRSALFRRAHCCPVQRRCVGCSRSAPRGRPRQRRPPTWSSRDYRTFPFKCVLHKSEIKLFLMHSCVTSDVDRANIIFNLVQDIALGTAQRSRHFRIDTKGGLLISPVVHGFAQRSCMLEQLITNRLRRLHQTGTLAVLTWRAQRSL